MPHWTGYYYAYEWNNDDDTSELISVDIASELTSVNEAF